MAHSSHSWAVTLQWGPVTGSLVKAVRPDPVGCVISAGPGSGERERTTCGTPGAGRCLLRAKNDQWLSACVLKPRHEVMLIGWSMPLRASAEGLTQRGGLFE